jgi:triphosphoribosyl-dephospho-CoA synthase
VYGRGQALDCEGVCAEVADICQHLVERELNATTATSTAGERLYGMHGLTGARGEAQSGFATARAHGVQPYLQARADGMDDEAALFEALLHLMANNLDTNLVSRGGIEGLFLVQTEARRLLSEPQPVKQVRVRQLAELDLLLTQHNLSPGGSADLLAVSWFLANLSDLDVTTK